MAYQATGNRPVGWKRISAAMESSTFPNFFILPDNNGGSFVPE